MRAPVRPPRAGRATLLARARLLVASGLAFAAVAPALAQQFKLGPLTIERPWVRATPKGAEVASGYLVIRNDGDAADTLTGVTADFAVGQVHEMKMDGGMMTMRELPDGLEIPPHGAVTLSPGGYHLMFVKLTRPLAKGDAVDVTLSFAHAGKIDVRFPVAGVGASGPDM